MHAVKRSSTLVYLDLTSVVMTARGCNRVLRSLSYNESLQHLVVSNSEGQMKNSLGWKFLENLQPLFKANCFL